jgi:hypothetical protein
MNKTVSQMTAIERRDYHFAEMKRAISEIYPDIHNWSVDFGDDRDPRDYACALFVTAYRPATDRMQRVSAANLAEREREYKARREAEAEYRNGILSKFAEGSRL